MLWLKCFTISEAKARRFAAWREAARREAERREAERVEAEWREAERREAERREAKKWEAKRRWAKSVLLELAEWGWFRCDLSSGKALSMGTGKAERREAERRRAMLVQLKLAAHLGLPSGKALRGCARFWTLFEESREWRTRLGKSLRYPWKVHLWKPTNRSGYADPVQICSDRMQVFLQIVCRSRAEIEESMQILKKPCNGYNELSSKELICEPRSPGDSKGCNSGEKKENDLMTRFAPVLKQRLHDALEPIFAPVACELQRQGEEACKELERLLALEKQKLALNLKDLKRLKRRQAGRFQRSRRASPAFPRRRRQGQGHCLRFSWMPKY